MAHVIYFRRQESFIPPVLPLIAALAPLTQLAAIHR